MIPRSGLSKLIFSPIFGILSPLIIGAFKQYIRL